jgi:hypothetical protein
VKRTPLLAIAAIAVASVGVSIAVAWSTMPSNRQLDHDAADELGIPRAVIDSPFVQPFLDDVTQRLRSRAVDEVRWSIVTGISAGVLVALVGTVTLLAASRRDPKRSPEAGRGTRRQADA